MKEKYLNSVALYDDLSIVYWLKIVDCVQQFSIKDGSREEFIKNLRILHNALKGTAVSLDEGKRYAKNFWNVGLATLVQAIYEIRSLNKKELFTHQINTLRDLGVSEIIFSGNTSDSVRSMMDIYRSNSAPIYLYKTLTDASFCVEIEGGKFIMNKPQDLNYSIRVALEIGNKIRLIRARADLWNFNVILPHKEDIMASDYPDLERTNGEIIPWQVTDNERVKQHFGSHVRQRKM